MQRKKREALGRNGGLNTQERKSLDGNLGGREPMSIQGIRAEKGQKKNVLKESRKKSTVREHKVASAIQSEGRRKRRRPAFAMLLKTFQGKN